MSIRPIACGGIFFVVATFLTSCSDGGFAEVRGMVRFEGQPVENGSILFVSTDANSATEWGGPIKDGQYSAKVPHGTMKVKLSWLKPTGTKRKAYEGANSPEISDMEEALPAKYNAQTELKLEVTRGTNKKDWELTK